MFKVAVLVNKPLAYSIFREKDLAFMETFARFNPIEELPDQMTREFMSDQLKDADAAITGWGTPSFTEEMLRDNPKLRFIAHSAGTVKNLVPASFWTMVGKHITSNAPVIAEDVAQTTLMLILSALKEVWSFTDLTRSGGWKGGEKNVYTTRRLDDLKVGIIGASLVGKEVVKILKHFRPVLRIWDPYLSPIEAEMLEIEQMGLDELIASSDVITLHAPANEDCRHILNGKNIPLIKDGAVLVNTARGMLIDEEALVKELQTGRFFACLDVTDPEPPAADHPLRTMPNVIITPHVAGGHTVNGRKMLGRNSIKEVYNFLTKGLIAYEVRFEMLEHMA